MSPIANGTATLLETVTIIHCKADRMVVPNGGFSCNPYPTSHTSTLDSHLLNHIAESYSYGVDDPSKENRKHAMVSVRFVYAFNKDSIH
jgi:hypothetical protein